MRPDLSRLGDVRVPPRLMAVGIVVLSGIAVAGLAVLPARTYIVQRELRADATAERDQLAAEIAELQAQLDVLQTDEEIERRARSDFDLVYPGEESFRILPAD